MLDAACASGSSAVRRKGGKNHAFDAPFPHPDWPERYKKANANRPLLIQLLSEILISHWITNTHARIFCSPIQTSLLSDVHIFLPARPCPRLRARAPCPVPFPAPPSDKRGASANRGLLSSRLGIPSPADVFLHAASPGFHLATAPPLPTGMQFVSRCPRVVYRLGLLAGCCLLWWINPGIAT